MTKKSLVALGVALCTFSLNAQNVGIGTPAPKATLDVSSSSSGLLIPRMTTAQRNAITTGADQNGMQVYDTDTKSIWYYDNNASSWQEIKGYDGKFLDGVNPIDAVYTAGNVGVGTDTPTEQLHVDGTLLSDSTIQGRTLKAFDPSVATVLATGGDVVTTSGPYTIHTFNSDGTFTPNGNTNVEYLVVAGGGAGGYFTGGGGGGGGVLTGNLTVANSPITVTVGAGGAGTASHQTSGSGGNSVFSTITAIGGGGAGSNGTNGANGGSGGGCGYVGTPGQGTAGQGNDGGTTGPDMPNYGASGGGGAGAAGENSTSTTGGNGGVGIQSSISGTDTWYGGGGGGGVFDGGTPGTGGLGGGGDAAPSAVESAGTAGAPNTGGGGGGSGTNSTATSSDGGSGIVIVRYLTPDKAIIATKDEKVGIGTSVPSARLSVNGDANKPGGGSWGVFSDKRSKENIQPYDKGLETLEALRPVSFQYKEEFGWGTDTHVGLIAQEVEEVVPSMVATKEVQNIKDFKEVDPNELTYMLVNTIKELTAQNDALSAQLKEIQRKAATQKDRAEAQAQQLERIKQYMHEKGIEYSATNK